MAWMVVQLRSASSSRLCSCVDSDIVNRWPSAAAVVTLVRNKKSSSSNELEMAIDRTIDRWTIKFPSSSLHRIDVFKIGGSGWWWCASQSCQSTTTPGLAQGSMDADGIIIITNAVVIQSDKYPKPNRLLQLCMRRRVQEEVNEVE